MKEDNMTLDELLESDNFNRLMNNLKHIPQMQPQSHASNTLADTGRYPEHMYN